jgi:hypothetical protein
MRCVSCNCVLTDFEATRKAVVTNDYIDMCNKCFLTIADDIEYIERDDLNESDLQSETND